MSADNVLFNILNAPVENRPDGAFLTDTRLGRTLTFAGLYSAAHSISQTLSDRKIRPGDRVAYLTKNSPFFCPLFFACASGGAVLAPIGRELHENEIKSMLKDARPAIIFADGPAYDKAACCSSSTVDRIKVDENWIAHAPEASPGNAIEWVAEPCDKRREALIIYTSGTTTKSKGIVLTHGNLDAMSKSLTSVYQYDGGRRFLCVLPFYHINAPMLTGVSCIRAGPISSFRTCSASPSPVFFGIR